MVVVQPGQDGSAAGVEHTLPVYSGKVLAHLVNPRADPDVGHCAVQQRSSLN
jgi:hypothetical protein